MQKKFNISFFIPIVLTIFISCFFIPVITLSYSENGISLIFKTESFSNSTQFLWPTPGYSKITSKFGYRAAPTNGASKYHGGIDIGAPEGSLIVAIEDGTVMHADWNGANGYTVIINHDNNYQSTYGHVSPNFIVSKNEKVKKGQIIAKVGPKYITQKSYTTYTDSSGKYTNGATTRSASTLCCKFK